ncbi:GntR family transcriptional regulator [Mesorhizobium sp. YIM 152430]|uniref:GntR family transcriptional regulator n=1 Tax=Mesorhizobium sp. YIM 152430 TaxID=3031761 RepID=UPI0023DB1095|nr:GntR family transcriptional regulator [Mesorhizobium sp. YIM 152430]MDF1598918.1 GntR family transcriptional regulator [Mesorhizobium sp. YIM 152430]
MDRTIVSDICASEAGPTYRRLADALAAAIRNGDHPSGTALPTERNLASQLGLARVTVRSAYAELARLGLIEIRPGSGAYVRQPLIEQALWRLSSFTEDMAVRGLVAGTRLLRQEISTASQAERTALGIDGSVAIVRLERLRLADDQPLAIETAAVPADIFGTDIPALRQDSLYSHLGDRGFRPMRARQRLRAISLEPAVAALLGVQTGSPALLIERVSFLADGRPVEFTRSHYRGDAYDFIAELDANGGAA